MYSTGTLTSLQIYILPQVETNSLVSRQPLPINTLDVQGHSIVFGGDNEAFYILHNILM